MPANWEYNSVPTKTDVAVVPKGVAKAKKFALKAGKGNVALDIRIRDENVDLVIGRGTTGQFQN